MEKLFFIPPIKTPEVLEIVSLLDKNAVAHEPQVCVSSETDEFIARLNKLVESGYQPVMLGWGCYCSDKNGGLEKLQQKVPDGVLVLQNTQKQSWLKQVAKMLNIELTVQQKLKGYLSTWSFGQLRAKGFSSEEILSLVREEFVAEGGSEADLAEIQRDIEHLSRVKLLVIVNLESRANLMPAKFYLEEYCFAEQLDVAALVTFRDGSLPAYIGKPSIAKDLCKKFAGTLEGSGNIYCLSDGTCQNAFQKKIKSLYK